MEYYKHYICNSIEEVYGDIQLKFEAGSPLREYG